MTSRLVLEQFAATVHAVWCDDMLNLGWRRGEKFDERARTHDALAPFAELPALDRRNALDAAERLARQVIREVRYPRGADREFTTTDIRVGLRVGKSVAEGGESATDTHAIGEIVGWECEASQHSSLLSSIRVRWEDGSITEHIPSMRELRRL